MSGTSVTAADDADDVNAANFAESRWTMEEEEGAAGLCVKLGRGDGDGECDEGECSDFCC